MLFFTSINRFVVHFLVCYPITNVPGLTVLYQFAHLFNLTERKILNAHLSDFVWICVVFRFDPWSEVM